ncbi:INO80 complex subunit D-B [Silurus asotus]|uniref:INO80 complex subunit D-B n=1 Tax=Silurus asotus TaxID=30991 RepID=A0AAD5FFI6_SILAS|nr:INO80 complex subunit D-B [Silurus asotus]
MYTRTVYPRLPTSQRRATSARRRVRERKQDDRRIHAEYASGSSRSSVDTDVSERFSPGMYEGKHIHYSEVDRKPLCSYSPKLCKQRRLNGYAFCIRHVLEDRSAPFRQCEYVAKYNSQRCTNPIPQTQDRKYCSSHLQVMGVLPKKERKKKQDTLESLALNITVPSLALKAPNDLDHLLPSSPSSLTRLLPLDPYSFFQVDKVKKEDSNLGKKATNRSFNPKQKLKDQTVASVISPHSISLLSQLAVGPPQAPLVSKSPLISNSQHPKPKSGPICTTTSAQAAHHTLTTKNPKPEIRPELVLTKIVVPPIPSRASVPMGSAQDPRAPAQHQAQCLTQLHRLMEQQRRKQEDLRPHFDPDWSEDSGEEDESQVEKVTLSKYPIPQDKSSVGSGSRGERLAGLCGYLRQMHRQMSREERGFRRERKSQHTLRKALLQAATHDPDRTAQLIEKRRTDISATSRSQQLFSSCTARFADGAQCSVPVFDITHQTPLCQEHAKKMDNFLRGDVSRRTYHYQQQLQQRRRLKKAKLPALGKKHKKKGRKGAVLRPQKPIPPALPQGNLDIPSVLCLQTQTTGIRSPLTPDLSADELPDDITSDISDIPHDLELNQDDFSDVLSRFPDDLQDFDLFEGKQSELLPTSEEAEELVRVLQDMGSYPESLACLSSIAEFGPVEGSDCRGMEGGVMDLLGARLSAETLSSLELDPSLLPTTEDTYPHSPRSPLSSISHLRDIARPQRRHLAHIDDSKDELVDDDVSHGSWGVLALPLGDSTQLHSLITSDGLLMSTALSTPPTLMPTASCQPTATLSALPESSLTIPVTSPSSSSPRVDFLFQGQLKHTLPSWFSHCGIPADLQPHHSAPAPTMDQT